MWQDIIWQFLALGDGDAALANLRANRGYTPEEGESRAHTFHWIRNLAALGNVDTTVTANHPLAKVFSKNGARTYVASNITAQRDHGDLLQRHARSTVPAGKTVTTGAYTWSGGNADGGAPRPRRPRPTPTPHPHAAPRPLRRPPRNSGSRPATCSPAAGCRHRRYSAAPSRWPPANGNHDGTPTNAQVFTATGLTGTYTGGATAFDLFVDAGTAVANGIQVRVSYDLTGNGSWDRVETYRYFATDPVAGLGALHPGRRACSPPPGRSATCPTAQVKVEVWSAIGNGTTTLGVGNQSLVRLPFS